MKSENARIKEELRKVCQGAEAKTNEIKEIVRILFGWQIAQNLDQKITLRNNIVSDYKGTEAVLTLKQSSGGIELENNHFLDTLCISSSNLSAAKNNSLPVFLALVQSELRPEFTQLL